MVLSDTSLDGEMAALGDASSGFYASVFLITEVDQGQYAMLSSSTCLLLLYPRTATISEGPLSERVAWAARMAT